MFKKNIDVSKLTLTLLFFVLTSCTMFNTKQDNVSVLDIKKVAVFPFKNLTEIKDAGKIVSEIFISELHKSRLFIVEEPANISRFILQEKITTIGELDIESALVLGRRLKTEYVLFASVEEFGLDRRKGTPVIALSARLINTTTGDIYWYNYSREYGDDYRIIFNYGTIHSVSKLVKKVTNKMVDSII